MRHGLFAQNGINVVPNFATGSSSWVFEMGTTMRDRIHSIVTSHALPGRSYSIHSRSAENCEISPVEPTLVLLTKKRSHLSNMLRVRSARRSITSKIPSLQSSKRMFWSSSKISRLETIANDPINRTNPSAQRDLYRELLRSGNANLVIQRYEQQPQLGPVGLRYSSARRDADVLTIQRDPQILELYIAALAKEGKLERIAARHGALLAHHSSDMHQSGSNQRYLEGSDLSNRSSSPDSRSYSQQENVSHSKKPHVDDWQQRHDKQGPSSLESILKRHEINRSAKATESSPSFFRFGENRSGSQSSKRDPIEVVVVPQWSWVSFLTTNFGRIIWVIIGVTVVSTLLEQQGMNKAEVEPNEMNPRITFDDVQGVDEAKHELEEVVAFLKNPAQFMELGGKLPKGVLLYGPPGTGKTHLARAVAGEAGVPFFQMSGSQFDELFVGLGARRVRELFAAAKARAPCIIFIDELDAVASKRSMRDQSYMRQTLNQLLVELDGFNSAEGVVFIGATNTPESLDKALTRPGRLDRLVPVPLPDIRGRTDILRVHMKGVKIGPDVKPDVIARGTPGFSGADLSNLVNQAAIHASKRSASFVSMQDMEWAKDKIIMGAERKSAVITEENKRLTAYHEGGHTIVNLYTKGSKPLHKVTVIPRGSALGVTVQLPETDVLNYTRRELLAQLDVSMGGRVAEELIYGVDEYTTGASSDLQNATSIARQMVMRYGMSEKAGLTSMDDNEYAQASPHIKNLIDQEVNSILEASYHRAYNLLKSKKNELHLLAKALMDYESLDADEVKKVIKGESLNR